MGVAGSGKTPIGTKLADVLHCAFLEGDMLHPKANVDKMGIGIPLTDADRAPWLAAIHAQMHRADAMDANLVVACSALKRAYRIALAQGLAVTWVYLKGSAELIRSRLLRRTGHFMKAAMLPSQFQDLEEPADAIVVDIAEPPATIVQRILARLPRTTEAERRTG